MSAVYKTDIKELDLLFRGKVRDVYDLDDELLIVTTDRISAFDVVLPDPIPKKGEVLTQVTRFWMEKFKDIIPNHLTNKKVMDVISDTELASQLEPRSMIVKKCEPLPVECVVRGYIIGSGWKDYQKTGKVCGIELPKGLQQAQQLENPIFTPATKAAVGAHDENVSFDYISNEIGEERAKQLKDISIELYNQGTAFAEKKGIIVADTKFEFGVRNGELVLIDEVLTPDSSRFWPKDQYQVNMSPPSFDKQFVRDYLETLDWDKTAPGPNLPKEIIEKTSAKYSEALTLLTK